MNEQIKAEWLEALRSGKYQQGRENLRFRDQYCCLGVLCDVVADRLKHGVWQDDGYGLFAFHGESDFLPNDVAELAGIEPDGARADHAKIAGVYHSLADANDQGCTFTEIADFIEKEF